MNADLISTIRQLRAQLWQMMEALNELEREATPGPVMIITGAVFNNPPDSLISLKCHTSQSNNQVPQS